MPWKYAYSKHQVENVQALTSSYKHLWLLQWKTKTDFLELYHSWIQQKSLSDQFRATWMYGHCQCMSQSKRILTASENPMITTYGSFALHSWILVMYMPLRPDALIMVTDSACTTHGKRPSQHRAFIRKHGQVCSEDCLTSHMSLEVYPRIAKRMKAVRLLQNESLADCERILSPFNACTV